MTIALVQSAVSTIVGSGTDATATLGSNTTAGNLLVAIVQNVAGDVLKVTMSDNQSGGGNTWVLAQASPLNSSTSTEASIWYCNAKDSAACAVTAHSTIATVAGIVCRVLEYSGAASSSPLGAVNNAGPTTSTAPSVNLTSVAVDSLVIGVCNSNAARATVGSGYTAVVVGDSFYYDQNEHNLDSASGTVTVDFANSSCVWVVAAAEFKISGVSLTSYYLGSDIASGAWTTSTGSGTLASMVDETVADDADYIQSALNPSADLAELQWANVQPPGLNTSHAYSYRVKGDASCPAVVKLIAGDGATIVQAWTHTALPSVFTQFDRTIGTATAGVWAAAGYVGSRLRLTAN